MIGIKEIAQAVSKMDDHTQARLINSLAFHLRMECENRFGYENQLCGWAKHLDRDGKEMIRSLAEFIALEAKHV